MYRCVCVSGAAIFWKEKEKERCNGLILEGVSVNKGWRERSEEVDMMDGRREEWQGSFANKGGEVDVTHRLWLS